MSTSSSSSSSSGGRLSSGSLSGASSSNENTPFDEQLQATKQLNKQKVKRSRNGCTNCKKLKIKCDEARPACEYCVHRKKECVYQSSTQLRTITSKKIQKTQKSSSKTTAEQLLASSSSSSPSSSPSSTSLVNSKTQSLNSLLAQLHVSNFELRLLKYFVDFGGSFFSFGKNKEIHDFWETEVPKMWAESELMRTAMYALSSIQLWTQYKLKEITNVYVDDDQSLVIYEDFNEKKGTTLYERTNNYFQKTLTLLKTMSLDEAKINDPRVCGQVIASNIIVFAFVSVHPISPVSVIAFQDGSNGFMVDILEICRNFHLTVYSRFRTIMNTKYIVLTYHKENAIFPPEEPHSMFKFVDHLRYYIDSRFDRFEPNHLTYHNCISAMEVGCFRSLKLGYVMPLFRTIINITKDADFIHLVRAKDYTALKLMFYYSALCSISGFKLFRDNSIWDSFVFDFKNLAYSLFNGTFEDEFDQAMYDTVIAFKSNTIRFELNMLKTLGKVDYRSFTNMETPLIKAAVVGYPPLPKL